MKSSLSRRRWVPIFFAAALSVGFSTAKVARGELLFLGGDPNNNANGTDTNFFNSTDVWIDTTTYTLTVAPASGPDPNTGATMTTMNINTGVTDTGVVFDPANQDPSEMTFNTNGKVYVASNDAGPGAVNGTLLYSSEFPNNPYQSTVANYFDVASGEFHINGTGTTTSGLMIVGRSAPGTLEVNGGTLVVDSVIEVGGDSSNVVQTGTVVYDGGVLQAGLISSPGSAPGIRLGTGNGCSGTFVDYNNGPGNITFGGFYVAYQAAGTGTTGNVIFHYSNGGVMPIQVHNSAATAQLSIRDSGTQSPRLSFDLDSSPTMSDVGDSEVPQNIGLFSVDKITGITGNSKDFYDSTGTVDLAEGTAITERAPNGYTDTWDISYEGTITFLDPTTSAISSITGPNNLLGDSTNTGTDIVLIGVSAIAPVTGDANGDGIVDSLDYNILNGNLGDDVTGGYADADFNDDGVVNADDVAIFQLGVAEYNAGNHNVPEPASMAILGVVSLLGIRRRRGSRE